MKASILTPEHQRLIFDNPNLSDESISNFTNTKQSVVRLFRDRKQCRSDFIHNGIGDKK